MAGRSYEWQPLLVLVETGGLADEEKVPVEVALGPHDLGPALCQPAGGAPEGALADDVDLDGTPARHVPTICRPARGVNTQAETQTTILPSSMKTSPSTVTRPPRRRSQTMSQWTADSLRPPVSG